MSIRVIAGSPMSLVGSWGTFVGGSYSAKVAQG